MCCPYLTQGLYIIFYNTNRFLSSWLPLIRGQPSQFDTYVHNMFKIQTYLLLTKFTYFISGDMYFCNKSSVSGSLEVVFFFSIEYPTCHCDNALQAHEKNPTLPTTCFVFVCVPGKLVTLTTPRFCGPGDSPGHHLPQEPPQGLGSWPCAFGLLSELMLRKLAQPIQTQSSFIQQLWD